MKNSTVTIIALLALIAVLFIGNLVCTQKEELAVFEEPQPPRPAYAVYGTGIDITPFISDIEAVNGIDCTCIIYDGAIIYVP